MEEIHRPMLTLVSPNTAIAPVRTATAEKSKRNYSKRKEECLEFILKHNLNAYNLRTCPEFLLLEKKVQNSIRYHIGRLRPQENKKIEKEKKVKAKGREESVVAKAATIFPILIAEIIICFLSAKSFQALGLGPIVSGGYAFAIECFYMFSSYFERGALKLLRLCILAFSIVFIGYQNISNDHVFERNKKIIEQEIKEITSNIEANKKTIHSLEEKEKILNAGLKEYFGHGFVTRGLENINPELKEIQHQIDEEKNNIKKLSLQVTAKIKEREERSSLSIKTISELSIPSFLIFFAVILIQISTSAFLPDSLRSLFKITKKVKIFGSNYLFYPNGKSF